MRRGSPSKPATSDSRSAVSAPTPSSACKQGETDSSSTPASASPGTTERHALTVLVALALAAPLLHASCTSTNEQDQEDEELADEELSEEKAAEDAAKRAAERGGLPLPAKPTAWHTKTLVATKPQPAPERIFACIEKVAAIAKEAGNQQAMLDAQAATANLAAADEELYHYCFLQMMVRLDERLSAGGALMSDRAGVFLDGMKALWILARGLDVAQGRSRYFEYLRARYVQLSQDHFGRDVDVVGPAMAPLR